MRILVLIQKPVFRDTVSQTLSDCGHEPMAFGETDIAWQVFQAAPFPVVITDIDIEKGAKDSFAGKVRQLRPETQVIFTTGHPSSLSEAITTLRGGSFSYLVKTFEDVGLVSASLNRAIDNVRVVAGLRKQVEDLEQQARALKGVNKTLKKIEVRDSLTGLHSQLHFHETLGRELIRSIQYNRPFSLLLVDIQMATGQNRPESPCKEEKQLQLAHALKTRLRRSDLITIYRDKTFGILLPETAKDAAFYVIKNLLELLEQFPFGSLQERGELEITFCFGLASYPEDGNSTSGLLAEAETTLRQSRAAGGQLISRENLHDIEKTDGSSLCPDLAQGPRRRVLVVDDDESLRSLLALILEDANFEVTTAANGEEALKFFEANPFPVLISDVIMPGVSGMELLERVKSLQPETEVVIMTSQTDLTPSIKALRSGAFDYLGKPFDDLDIVPIVAERAFDNYCRISENHRLIAELERKNKGMTLANKALQDLVIRDGLTGLYNHSYFKEALEIEIVRSKRYNRQFSVLFMDLDNFKNYNDTCGHPEGDRLLHTLSEIITDRLRKSDILARYGGEEFTAILPELSKQKSLEVADEIRQMVEQYPFAGRETQPGGKVTITIGLASYPEDGTEVATLINSADQALYRGKHQGRNRVTT